MVIGTAITGGNIVGHLDVHAAVHRQSATLNHVAVVGVQMHIVLLQKHPEPGRHYHRQFLGGGHILLIQGLNRRVNHLQYVLVGYLNGVLVHVHGQRVIDGQTGNKLVLLIGHLNARLLLINRHRTLGALRRINVRHHEVERNLMLDGQDGIGTLNRFGIGVQNGQTISGTRHGNLARTLDGYGVTDIFDDALIFPIGQRREHGYSFSLFENVGGHNIGLKLIVGHS